MRTGMKAMLLSTVVLSLGAAATAQAETLRYGLVNPASHISVEMAERLGDLLEERTDGDLTVDAFPAQQLIRSDDWFQGVRLGTVELGSGALSLMEGIVPEITILDAPYLFETVEHAQKALQSEAVADWNERLQAEGGVRVLAWWLFGIRHLATTKPILSPSEMQGTRIRDVPSPVLLATLEGMGAVAVPLDWGEAFAALQTGVVEGLVNPVDIIYNAGLQQVVTHVQLTGHTMMLQPILMNERKFQSLSEENQQAVLDAAAEAAAWQWEAYLEREAGYVQQLQEAGVEILGPEQGLDLEAFKEAAHGYVVNRYIEVWGEDTYRQLRSQ